MLRYLENVVTLRLDAATCNGCGMCAIVCPHGVFEVDKRKAAIIDLNACIECGACAINCPVNAIRVQTGAGCAAGILMGAIGKGGGCSSPCGVSPSVGPSTQNSSCGTASGKDAKTAGEKSSCCG